MKFGDLRGILQYVPQFRGRVFVIAVDGAVLASPNLSNLLLDLAVLHSLSIKVVLVHGASRQIRELARSRGLEISNDDGTGVVDGETLNLSIEAISRLATDLMQSLSGVGLRAAIANIFTAHPEGIIDGVDRQKAGHIDRVDTGSLDAFLGQGMVPLVSPLGYSTRGEAFRLNSDAAAARLAVDLKADKLLFLHAGGLRLDDGTLRQLSVDTAQERAPFLDAGLRSKLSQGALACRNGVPRAHILNGLDEDALLAELFSNEGVGTMVYADEYHQIRKATERDVDELLAILSASVQEQRLRARTREDILAAVDDYFVLEVDGNVIGTVAVHFYEKETLAELACLYIKKSHERSGHGMRLTRFAEGEAKRRGATAVFALTTQAVSFFEERAGYQVCAPEMLPARRLMAARETSRNARVLKKDLDR